MENSRFNQISSICISTEVTNMEIYKNNLYLGDMSMTEGTVSVVQSRVHIEKDYNIFNKYDKIC